MQRRRLRIPREAFRTMLSANNDNMEQRTAHMFRLSHGDSLRREREQAERFSLALRERDRESRTMARDQLTMTSQVAHLSSAVNGLREQLSTQADFTVRCHPAGP